MEHLPEHAQAERDAEQKERQSRIRAVIDSVFADTALLEDIGILPSSDESEGPTA